MPGVSIPNDWDGETWQCIQVQFPASVGYTAIIAGLLDAMTRGRFWERETGIITDAQAIGREIARRNMPFTACSGEPVPYPVYLYRFAVCDAGYGETIGESEEEVSVLDIKIENGKLYKRMSPCCEWFEVGDLSGILSPDIGDDPLNPDDEALTYSACGKAYAVVDAIYRVAQSCYDERAESPAHYWKHVKEDNPDINLSAIWVLNAILKAIKISVIDWLSLGYAFGDIFDATMRQSILCRVVRLFNDDSAGVDSDLFKEIMGAFKAQWGFDVLTYGFWEAIIEAIGRGDLNNIAKLGALDTAQDCNCPSFLADPRDDWPSNDWAYWHDVKRYGVPEWATLGGDSIYVAGQGVKDEPGESGYMNPEIRAELTFAADTIITYGYLRYRVLWAGSDYQGNYTYCKSLDAAGHVWNGDFTPDTDPSGGGTITHTRTVVLNPPEGVTNWAWALEMNTLNGADDTRLVYIEAIGLAGTGTDPFPT